MRKVSLLVLIAAMVSFVAVSCKKYEDGPTFSLASKKGRVAGEWTIEKATDVDNGSSTDITASMQAYWTKVEFTKDGDVKLDAYGSTYSGTWKFDDKKENIVISIEGETWTWEIKRLKQKELWVKWVYDTAYPEEYMELELKQ